MTHTRRFWRWTAAVVGLVAVVGAIGIVASHGPGAAAAEPLWSERPVIATPAAGSPQLPWVALARQLKPAVVNISTKHTESGTAELGTPSRDDGGFDPYFQKFFGERPHTVRSLGSGFIINASGYVVTNAHVVDEATEIKVKLSDGREFPAQAVGRDTKTDVALLKIPASGLPVIPLGSSRELEVGEPVMAIGNPFGLAQTVTTGIVSATGRVIGAGPYDDFIQTDASVNPGNSGGPLIDTRGEAIGINSAIFTADGGSNGIGFAIPISLAKLVITQLATSGHVVRGWLGVTTQALTPELAKGLGAANINGALVASVMKDSPAMAAGLKPGDVIVAYDRRAVDRPENLSRAVADTPIGRDMPIAVLRDGQRQVLSAKIQEFRDGPRPKIASAEPAKGGLGVAVQSLTPELSRELGIPDQTGVLVKAVQDSSPAAEAGIRSGDVIVEINRHPVTSANDVTSALKTRASGSPLVLLVHRNGDGLFVAVD
jgi:serine protease Do